MSGGEAKLYGWRRDVFSSSSSVRLEFHWTFVVALIISTSIAAYGVNPHIESVSTGTGQERPRPRFPAEHRKRKSAVNHLLLFLTATLQLAQLGHASKA